MFNIYKDVLQINRHEMEYRMNTVNVVDTADHENDSLTSKHIRSLFSLLTVLTFKWRMSPKAFDIRANGDLIPG